MDCNGTTVGSENGAEINSEPTTSTDANRQADLPMANRRSLLPVLPDRVDDFQPKSSPKPAPLQQKPAQNCNCQNNVI